MVGERRIVGHTIEVSEEDVIYSPAHGIEASIAAKLAAEEARIWRLLPDPPAGHHWAVEQQRLDHHGWEPYKFRVVAYLEKD